MREYDSGRAKKKVVTNQAKTCPFSLRGNNLALCDIVIALIEVRLIVVEAAPYPVEFLVARAPMDFCCARGGIYICTASTLVLDNCLELIHSPGRGVAVLNARRHVVDFKELAVVVGRNCGGLCVCVFKR